MYRKTYVEININRLMDNVKEIKNCYPDYKYYIGIVKADAYGHSDLIVKYLIESGINYVAASSLEECIRIRKHNSDIPILCLEPIDLEYIDLCVNNDITITLHDYDYFKALINKQVVGKLKIHLKIDSGMNRLGIKDQNEVNEIVSFLNQSDIYDLEGIYTHFATAGTTDQNWDNQLNKFKMLTSDIDLSLIPIVHLGRSQTLVNHSKISFANGIRLGIVMYGFSQSISQGKGIKAYLRAIKNKLIVKKAKISPTTLTNSLKLKKAFSLYTEIIQIKRVNKGEYIGYGTNCIVNEDMIIAICPIGFADGLLKTNRGRDVMINNKRYPIIGEIGMDMITIKIDENVKISDQVCLINDDISVNEVSKYNHLSAYQLFNTITRRVPRVLVKDGKVVAIKEDL